MTMTSAYNLDDNFLSVARVVSVSGQVGQGVLFAVFLIASWRLLRFLPGFTFN